MKIAMLHGYLLRGSGSNIYVRNVTEELVKLKNNVYLFCQERHPEDFPFIKEAYRVEKGKLVKYHEKKIPHGAILVNPGLDLLPVYVMDKYPEFKEVKLFIDLSDEELSEYIKLNLDAMQVFFEKIEFDIIHANHLIMMPYIASHLSQRYNVPYIVTPHGSSLEYTIKKDPKFLKFAIEGIKNAKFILPGNETFKERLVNYFKEFIPEISQKIKIIPLGVDTSLFSPISPKERKSVIPRLINSLKNEQHGRTREFALNFLKNIRNATVNDIDTILSSIPSYSQRHPDEDLSEKLLSIDVDKDRLIAFVGRLIPGKGLHNFLLASIKLLQKFDNLKVIITGAGPMREWAEWLIYAASNGNVKIMKALIEWGMKNFESEKWVWMSLLGFLNAHIKDYETIRFDFKRVIFTGFLEHHYLAPLLALAEVSCFPSLVPESFGLVLLEAAATCSIPVATYFSGFKGILDTFKSVIPKKYFQLLILPMGNSEMISRIIENVSIILERQLDLCEPLRRIVLKEYSWSSVARKLQALYHSVSS